MRVRRRPREVGAGMATAVHPMLRPDIQVVRKVQNDWVLQSHIWLSVAGRVRDPKWLATVVQFFVHMDHENLSVFLGTLRHAAMTVHFVASDSEEEKDLLAIFGALLPLSLEVGSKPPPRPLAEISEWAKSVLADEAATVTEDGTSTSVSVEDLQLVDTLQVDTEKSLLASQISGFLLNSDDSKEEATRFCADVLAHLEPDLLSKLRRRLNQLGATVLELEMSAQCLPARAGPVPGQATRRLAPVSPVTQANSRQVFGQVTAMSDAVVCDTDIFALFAPNSQTVLRPLAQYHGLYSAVYDYVEACLSHKTLEKVVYAFDFASRTTAEELEWAIRYSLEEGDISWLVDQVFETAQTMHERQTSLENRPNPEVPESGSGSGSKGNTPLFPLVLSTSGSPQSGAGDSALEPTVGDGNKKEDVIPYVKLHRKERPDLLDGYRHLYHGTVLSSAGDVAKNPRRNANVVGTTWFGRGLYLTESWDGAVAAAFLKCNSTLKRCLNGRLSSNDFPFPELEERDPSVVPAVVVFRIPSEDFDNLKELHSFNCAVDNDGYWVPLLNWENGELDKDAFASGLERPSDTQDILRIPDISPLELHSQHKREGKRGEARVVSPHVHLEVRERIDGDDSEEASTIWLFRYEEDAKSPGWKMFNAILNSRGDDNFPRASVETLAWTHEPEKGDAFSHVFVTCPTFDPGRTLVQNPRTCGLAFVAKELNGSFSQWAQRQVGGDLHDALGRALVRRLRERKVSYLGKCLQEFSRRHPETQLPVVWSFFLLTLMCEHPSATAVSEVETAATAAAAAASTVAPTAAEPSSRSLETATDTLPPPAEFPTVEGSPSPKQPTTLDDVGLKTITDIHGKVLEELFEFKVLQPRFRHIPPLENLVKENAVTLTKLITARVRTGSALGKGKQPGKP